MKKAVCLLLTLLLCLTGIASVEAYDEVSWDFPEYGFSISVPEDFKDLKGQVIPAGPVELASGISIFTLEYVAAPIEVFEAMENHDEEVEEPGEDAYAPYLVVLIVEANAETKLVEKLISGGLEEAGVTCLAETDYFTYYSMTVKDLVHLEDPEYEAEYTAILDRTDEVEATLKSYEPRDPFEDKIGTKLSFETTDLDGNSIDSEELFSQHEYTLLNVWASWCGPCAGELGELSELNKSLADMDCAVVGILEDSAKDSSIEKAKNLMAEKGADYLCIKAPDGLHNMLIIKAFPTTYIIDRNGTIVGEPVVGAYVEQYKERIDELMEGKDAPAKNAEDDKPVYTVKVVDQNGDPVPEAAVTFCLDTGCVPVETDENGEAVFTGEAARYHIQIADAPDGYDYPDESDVYIGPEPGEVTLEITRE